MRRLIIAIALVGTLFASLASSAGATPLYDYCASLRPYTANWNSAQCWAVLGMPQFGAPPVKRF